MFQSKLLVVLMGGTALILANLLSLAAEPRLGRARGLLVQEINKHPAFSVRVWVDHANRIYEEGEEMKVTVKSEKEGYLYLLYCDAGDQVSCVFPNRVQKDNHIEAGEEVRLPAAGGNFKFRVSPPFGKEVLKAIVSKEPLKALNLQELIGREITTLTLEDVKGLVVEVVGGEGAEATSPESKQRNNARQWAEHQVEITTVAAGQGKLIKARPERRVGLFIGINQYLCPQIRSLKCCENDAVTMGNVLKEQGQLAKAIFLINKDATLSNIEKAFRTELVQETQPGDVVFVYWAGHGGRCADDNGDEEDGLDEYLVPHDGRLDDIEMVRNTMLLDDTLGRWIQELDGRKVILIFDTCHSGGQARGAAKGIASTPEFAKKISKGIKSAKKKKKKVDSYMLRTELKRLTKDIGQKEVAVLASSRASQVSFERREGDLSVMTYFLTHHLRNGLGPLTLKQMAGFLSAEVPPYVKKNFLGATQAPLLVDETTGPVYLRLP